MGRQHTTWISDETWDRLQNIAGESVSKKISNAVKHADPDDMMRHAEDLRRLARAKNALRAIAKVVKDDHQEICPILEEVEFLIWGADMEELE